MFFRPIAVVCLLFVIGRAFAGQDPTEALPGVVDLTPTNFDQIINGGKHAIIEFYAPWCGHCKSLTPEYTRLGAMVEKDPMLKSRVVIAKANADEYRELGDKFDVQGFPTIKYLPRGKAATKDNAEEYEAGRKAEDFIEYLMDKIRADKAFARVEALDAVASKFAEAADKASLVEDAKATVAGLSGEDKSNGELYVKYMEKAAEKGAAYLGTEKARLEKMLSSGSVHASKVEEMARKTSVLGTLMGGADA